jgi:alpha-amylase/alpha-mannosidase (GH57 family)
MIGLCWLGPEQNEGNPVSVRATYDTNQIEDIENHKESVREGLTMFESVFGYKSKSFIAPNFVYHSDLEPTLYENGVRYIQGMKYQKIPLLGVNGK